MISKASRLKNKVNEIFGTFGMVNAIEQRMAVLTTDFNIKKEILGRVAKGQSSLNPDEVKSAKAVQALNVEEFKLLKAFLPKLKKISDKFDKI